MIEEKKHNENAPHQTIFIVKAMVHENDEVGRAIPFPADKVHKVYTEFYENFGSAQEAMNKFIEAIEDVAEKFKKSE